METRLSGFNPSSSPASISQPIRKINKKYYLIYIIPEGTSTEHIGIFTLLRVSSAALKGGRASPLKPNPKRESITRSKFLLISSGFSGKSFTKSMRKFSHCTTRFLNSCFSERFG